MNFVFDTETTGLPARKSYDDYYAPENLEKYDKSRIVSIAWILFSGPRIISKNYFVIRPEGFLIDDRSKATEIHGITQAIAEKQGVGMMSMLNALYLDLSRCETVIAHNLQFDKHVLLSEIHRALLKDDINKDFCQKLLTSYLARKEFCTMKRTISLVGATNKYGRPKYPKLDELHTHFFGEKVMNAHNALADTEACYRCFLAIPRHLI
jgi:DNA polymerase III epsilon subunit-like protein